MTTANEKSPWVLEAEEATFQQDAVERSREMLVVVDFWATWCQPCRMLSPILEKLASDYAGKFLLVKADVDKLPNIAGGFGVQSIPAVYGMRDGKLLDFFVGLLSESQIRAWIDRLLPSEAEMLVSQARGLEADDPTEAEAKWRAAIGLDPNLAPAKIGLASLLFAQGKADESLAIVAQLEARGFLEPEAEKLKAQLHLMNPGQTTADLDALQAAADADPNDWQARLTLAEALAASGQYEPALEAALAVVATHKKEFAEPARKLMLDVFQLLPEESELLTTYRRRLSTALY